MFRHLPFIALASALMLAGCAVDSRKETVKPTAVAPDYSPVSDAQSVGNIYFDSSLSPKERGAMVTALGYLDNLELGQYGMAVRNLLKVNRTNGATLRRWIEDRVQYIANSASDEGKLIKLRENYQYANPGIFPPQLRNRIPRAAASQGEVLFSNLGLSVYFKGKMENVLYGIVGDGIGTFPISSPRSGLLLSGSGLFNIISSEHKNAVKLYNLSLIFHEARHSDGNRESTGFPHDDCPAGHEFAGLEAAACDHSYNGSYTVSVVTLEALLKTCRDCTTVEKNILAASVVNFAERIIKDNTTAILDDAPEGQR